MGDEHPATTSQQSSERFLSILNELERMKEVYVMQMIQKYRTWARRDHRLFQYSSVLIICLSVSLPFLSIQKGFWIAIILPIVALIVAGLTGLLSFFRFESNWKGFSQARYTLEHLLRVWELRIIEAKHEQDEQKAIEMALQATRQLLDDTQSTARSEAEEFFQRVQMPKS